MAIRDSVQNTTEASINSTLIYLDDSSPVIITDDLMSNIDDWTIQSGNWIIDADGLNSQYAEGLITHNTILDGINQWVLVRVQRRTSLASGGIYFRFTGDTSDPAYVLRYEAADNELVWMSCIDTTCSNIQVVSHNLNNTDYLSIKVSGVGSNTVVEVWDHGTSSPGNDTSTWGAPTHTLTNDPVTEANTGQQVGLYNGDVLGRTTFNDFSASTYT